MASSDTSRRTSNPSSTLLQDMLREKKAKTQRVNKTYDTNESDDRGVQSSPIASMSTRERQSRHGSGGSRNISIPKEMSMKEMEQHLSKINKQNFDLKLEVFHRRQRNEVLEAKVKEMEALRADNDEMQTINEDLLLELEKRDVAVREAVGLICELEAKVEAMEAKIEEMGAAEMYFGQPQTFPTISASPPTSFGPVEPSTPPQAGRQNPVSRQEPADITWSQSSHPRAETISPDTVASSRRVPSFLQENKKSTHVLRSLYSSESLLSGDEYEDDMDGHIISSPRLSILSESGFSEIYGDTKIGDRIVPHQTDGSNIPEESPTRAASPRDTHREARLQKWVEESNRPTTPARTSPKAAVKDHFSSIGEILDEVPSITKEHQPANQVPHERKDRRVRSPDKLERKETQEHQRRLSSPAFGGPMFGGAMLPPTPGTMSTVTIADNSSTPSIITEKSLLDGTPFQARGYSNLIPGGRPGSSDSNSAHYPSNALTFNEESDGVAGSPRRNKSPKATQVTTADAPIRPSLTTSATATVFSGEGYATIQPSRTLSYPSPTGRARRPFEQLSPTSEKSFANVSDRPTSLTQQHRRNRSSAATTPTKRGTRESPARSPPANHDPTTPIAASPNGQPEVDSKLGRSASLRSKITKMSLSPSQSTHQSVASRLFRRSNSQSVQAPSSAQPATTSRPPIARDNSSSRHARLPRPTSLYGSSPIYGQRPNPSTICTPRPHREPRQDSDNRPYKLTPILPEGMLTDIKSPSSPRDGRHEREHR